MDVPKVNKYVFFNNENNGACFPFLIILQNKHYVNI